MTIPTTVVTSLISVLHIYILVLEAFLWATPRGHKAFGMTPAFAAQTKILAANQGLYNGFLAAGLAWGLLHSNEEFGREIQLFFLGCVAIAGVIGGVTTGKSKIAMIQTVPATVGIVLVLLLG